MPSATSRKSLGLSFCCPYIKWGWVYIQTDANEGAQDLEINLLSENKPFSLQNKCILTLHHSSKACYPGLQPKSPRAHFTITEVLKKTKYKNHHHIPPTQRASRESQKASNFFVITHFEAVQPFPHRQLHGGGFQLAKQHCFHMQQHLDNRK